MCRECFSCDQGAWSQSLHYHHLLSPPSPRSSWTEYSKFYNSDELLITWGFEGIAPSLRFGLATGSGSDISWLPGAPGGLSELLMLIGLYSGTVSSGPVRRSSDNICWNQKSDQNAIYLHDTPEARGSEELQSVLKTWEMSGVRDEGRCLLLH